MIEITVANSVTVIGAEAPIVATAKKALSILNPAYQKIVRLTGSRWAAAEYFKYYNISKSGDILTFPRGFLARFTGYLDKLGTKYQLVHKTVAKPLFQRSYTKLELRQCQVEAVEMTSRHDEGLIVIGTGGGKTVTALEIIAKKGMTALIVVPTNVILAHFVREAEAFYGLDIGVLNGERKDIKEITVATWQSLGSNTANLERLIAQTSTMIVDECHGAVSKERMKILSQFRPTYLYGMTGTARRSRDDGRTDAIQFLFGPVIYEWRGTMLTPKVEMRNTKAVIPVLQYGEMVDLMVKHDARNEYIANVILAHHIGNRKTLVLTKRIEHFELLTKKLGDLRTVGISAKDKDRIETLQRLKTVPDSFDVLLGTSSLLGTGLDMPCLDTLIIAGDLKSDVLLEQSGGRILRLFEGKENPVIIDFYDKENPILYRQALARQKLYQELGWEITYW